jgi:hypothetical protein
MGANHSECVPSTTSRVPRSMASYDEFVTMFFSTPKTTLPESGRSECGEGEEVGMVELARMIGEFVLVVSS